jgi:hypothetical protein
MRRSWKILLSVFAGAVIAVPATIVLAGGSGDYSSGSADIFSTQVDKNKKATSKSFKPIPGMNQLFSTAEEQSVTFSAQIRKGTVKVRIIDTATNSVVPPGPVVFSSKAANSFSFGVPENCLANHEIQWKRVGKGEAVAAKLSAQRIIDEDICI